MSQEYKNIMELFDLPGIGGKEVVSDARSKEGITSEESKILGTQSLDDGDYEAAIKHFKNAVEQGGEGAGFDLGAAYEATDMIPQAFYQYEKARKTKASAEVYASLGALYRKYGKGSEAIREMELAVQAEPFNSFLHYKLAEVLRDNGYRKAAREAMSGAISSDPDEGFYHYWLGELLVKMKDFDEAAKCLQAALELSPGDDHYCQLAAVALWGQDKRKEAIRAIRLACDLDADSMVGPVILQRMLEEDGQVEEAKQEDGRVKKATRYDRDVAKRLLAPVGIDVFVPDHDG